MACKYVLWASLVAQLLKNLPAMWETWVRSLGREDPLEKGKGTPGQNTGVGCHFPSPGYLPNPGIEPGSHALQVDSLPSEPPGKKITSVQFSSVAQLCPTLCDPMNRSTPGLPVHHLLPQFTQTHVHRVHDAIQPSHPLSFPSPPAPNPSQHQGLLQ